MQFIARLRSFGICLWFVLVPLAAQEPEKPDPLKDQVQQLLGELDGKTLAGRNQAEKDLIGLGHDALQYLPPEDAPLSPEAKQRLIRIRAKIATTTAKVEVQSQSKMIGLNDAATLGDALEAISRDSGIEFDHQADKDKPIKPYVGSLPFWQALDYVLDQAELDIDFYGSEDATLALVPRAEKRPSRFDSAAYAEAFRLEPTIVTSRRVLSDESLSGMNVELSLSWKPDLFPVGITVPLKQLSAKLDDGATIGSSSPDGKIDIAPSKDLATTSMQLPLNLPAGRPTKIVAISGKLQSMLPGAIKEFAFPLRSGPTSKSEDLVTVKLEGIRKSGALHELRVAVDVRNAGKAMESHRGWLLGNQIKCTKDDGTTESHLGYEMYRHNDEGIGLSYLFDLGDSPDAWTLIYSTPTAVTQTEIDFVIRDIPMP